MLPASAHHKDPALFLTTGRQQQQQCNSNGQAAGNNATQHTCHKSVAVTRILIKRLTLNAPQPQRSQRRRRRRRRADA